jgi:hypothetical protein
MPAIKLEQFGGELPAWDAHLLPTGQAARTVNTYLFSGALEGWRQPKVLRALQNPSARFAYRVPTVSETQARAYLLFKANPVQGDTVVVGDLTYTFVVGLSPIGSKGLPGQVVIGANPSVTAANFAAALTADNGTNANMGVLYGNNTEANGDVFYPLPNTTPPTGILPVSSFLVSIASVNYSVVLFGSVSFGASFNTINVSESTGAARTTMLGDVLSLAHTTLTMVGGSNPTFGSGITAPSTWLEFNDPDTNVIKSPVVDDTFNRYYSASPSQMPQYNTYDRITAGLPAWLLGVPPPGCAPVVGVTGGGNNLTLGNYSQNSNEVPYPGNAVYLIPFTTPGATIIQDVQFRLGASTGIVDTTAKFAAVIYEDNAGVPGTLLNTGEVVDGVTTVNPNISSFVNPSALVANTQYWLGIIVSAQNAFQAGPGDNTANVKTFSAPFTNGPPGTAPAATSSAGINMWGDFVTSDVVESRAYVYTWVSAYNEEGPPSPPTLVDGWSNGTWSVGLWQPPPDDLGILRNLKNINIYRTVPGQGGATVFFFVATVPIGTPSYTDANPNNTVALNDQLSSTNWFPPPENLQGLTVMQNGMVAGFIGTEIWFCEPYRPHAWPPGYVITVDYPIVGLGMTNGTLVVATGANPFIVTGQTPGNMSQLKCANAHPCLSRGSILDGDGAVSYMSQNGLIQVNPQGTATNTTDLWFTREKWQQNTPQKYTHAIFLASCYYCLGTDSPPSVSPADTSVAQQGFTVELDQDNASFTIWPQPGGHRLGFNPLTSPTGFDIQNVMSDPWTGTGLLISNGDVYYFDFSDPAPAMVPYTWVSKIYQQNAKRNYEAMKVFFTVPTNTPSLGQYRNEAVASDPSWSALGPNQYGIIKTFADSDGSGNMVLMDCREIRASGELLRLIDGFKAEQWQWEIDARVRISNIQIATTAKELASV